MANDRPMGTLERCQAMRFEAYPNGDPFSPKNCYDIREIDGEHCWFRGDLSPICGKDNVRFKLDNIYPGCKVRFVDR
jgi:hypothetical protein